LEKLSPRNYPDPTRDPELHVSEAAKFTEIKFKLTLTMTPFYSIKPSSSINKSFKMTPKVSESI